MFVSARIRCGTVTSGMDRGDGLAVIPTVTRLTATLTAGRSHTLLALVRKQLFRPGSDDFGTVR